MATNPDRAGLLALVRELLKAMDDVYTKVVSEEIDQDFIELYVKPQQMGMDQPPIAFRAEITERGAVVSVTDGSGGVYLLPLPPVALSAESVLSVTTLIHRLLASHTEAEAIEASTRTGGCELVLRFDTTPDRFTLIRRRPRESPDILGVLPVADAG